MKTNQTKQKFLLLGVLFLMLFSVKGYSQANAYNCCIKNAHQTSPNQLEFDVWIEWTGSNAQKFQQFQAGINFNYAGIANGGVMTGTFKPGSADPALPAVQQAPNWNINATSKQIRMLAAIATPVITATTIPAPPGFRLGTFTITNTQPFATSSQPNFVWSFATGTSTTTKTQVACYLNGATTATDITTANAFAVHCIDPVSGNPVLNPPCPTANAGGPYTTCGDVHLNGSTANATTSVWSTSGTGTFDPDANTLNATYHPSAADLGSGVTLTLTADDGPGGCAPGTGSTVVNFTSTDDANACTVDGCDQSSGLPTHSPLNVDDNNVCTTDGCDPGTGATHTPISVDDGNPCTVDGCDSVTGPTHTAANTDDGNACTTDGCDSNTGFFHTPVNTDDGNACTTDACNTSTGAVTHTPVNTDDGDGCTTDACDTNTGAVTHTAVNTDDGNACTTDACNPSTGAITHTAVNTDDGNACTTDACDTNTGAVTHTPVNTDDGNACTTDACNTNTGAVTHTPVNTDDGNACTTDACDTNTGAVTHTGVNTDDGNACTVDACNTLTGAVTHIDITDDGNACTDDACDTNTGVTSHTPVNTDDGNACTTDGCNPSTGVFHTPVNTDDSNPCTIDACDTNTGAVTHTDDTPVVTATAGTIACYGGTTCVTVDATGGQPPYSGTGVLCGYGAGDYTFPVTDGKGCTANSNPVHIDQPTKLTLSPSSTPSSGSDGTASANPSGGTPPYSFLWSDGQTTDPATGLAPGVYNVTVTDANGCTESASVTVATSCSLDAPGPVSGPDGVCKKQSGVVFCATPNPFATSYVWTLPPGMTVVGSSSGPCITVTVTSKFKGGFVCVKAVTPCGTTPNACKNVVVVTKKAETPGPITGPSTLCRNANANYSIAPVPGATGYEWKVDGHQMITSGQGTTAITVHTAADWNGGKVKVKAINCKGKSGDRSKNVAHTTGCRVGTETSATTVIPTEALSSLVAYPNPTSGKAQITFTSDRMAKYSLKVVDMIGKVLVSETLSVVEGFNQKDINLEGMSKGIYMISVQTEEGNAQTLRLVVE